MLAQQLVNGVLLGATYALFALGFTLMFGVLRVINLTYGFYFSAGAFIALWLARAGCRSVEFGMDSLSDEAARQNNRRTLAPEDARDRVKALTRHRIASAALFVFGLPGDTPEAMARKTASIPAGEGTWPASDSSASAIWVCRWRRTWSLPAMR